MFMYRRSARGVVNIIEENNIILVMLGRNACYNDDLT